MREPCDCPSEYCEYDEDTEGVIGVGATIDGAAKHAKKTAVRAARREAEQALKEAEAEGDAICKKNTACPHGCTPWFRIEIGTPGAQEYPYHGKERQFALGWCDWKLIVKCECAETKTPKKKGG